MVYSLILKSQGGLIIPPCPVYLFFSGHLLLITLAARGHWPKWVCGLNQCAVCAARRWLQPGCDWLDAHIGAW